MNGVKVLPDKENCRKHNENQKKTVKTSHSIACASRNPLSTLSDNVPLALNGVQNSETFQRSTTRKSCLKKTAAKKTIRTRSTSDIEKKLRFRSPLVSVRIKSKEFENSIDDASVDEKKHLLSYLPGFIRRANSFLKDIHRQETKNDIKPTLSFLGKSDLKKGGIKPITRTCSTSDIERKLKFCSSSITVRNKAQDSENLTDEVFIDGKEHYLNYLPGFKRRNSIHEDIQSEQSKSDVKPTLPVVRISRGSNLVKKPGRKITLEKKLSGRYSRYNIEGFYSNYLYNEEYFKDNYQYMLETEGSFVFRRSYLLKYSNYSSRIVVINWLIYFQQALELSETTLFIAVRMFDNLLATNKLKSDNYWLGAIACIWISSKVYDITNIKVTNLYAYGNGRYSRNQIITSERDILNHFGFKLNFPDPLTFLGYYLKKENLETDSKIRYCAMFFLELFTFLLEFSSSSPSILAASALYLALVRFDFPCEHFVNYINNHLINEHTFKNYSKQMADSVKEILNCKCFTNEVVAKYSVPERLKVAYYFLSD